MSRFKIQSLSLVLISFLFTGCVVAVVAGAAAGMVYDRRSISTIESDARLFHVIHKAIARDRQFLDSRILVSSFNRIVLLVGQTPNPSVKAAAGAIAQSTPGANKIYNEITIGNPIPLTKRSQDSLITGQVRSAMLTRKGLESGSIRIITEQGVVYLMGIVTLEQSNLAVDVARRIKGVNKVVKIFQYIH